MQTLCFPELLHSTTILPQPATKSSPLVQTYQIRKNMFLHCAFGLCSTLEMRSIFGEYRIGRESSNHLRRRLWLWLLRRYIAPFVEPLDLTNFSYFAVHPSTGRWEATRRHGQASLELSPSKRRCLPANGNQGR